MALLVAAPLSAHAQSFSGFEGGAAFVLPIGARAVGMGQTGVVAAVGADAVWWNPALIARGPREAGLQISSKATATADADVAGAVVYSVRGVGAVALSVRYLNEGTQQANAATTDSPTGTFTPITMVAAASFAAPFGDRFAFGFTAKVLQQSVQCTGTCQQTATLLTSAIDLGAQYFLTSDSVLAVAAAARNYGFNLQVHDAPQADAPPERIEAGIEYAPKLATLPKEARVRAAADVIADPQIGGAPGYRLGAELSWMERYHARAGYVVKGQPGSGATLGFGFDTGKLKIDFAQMLSDLGGLGARPTYVTLRYLF